MLLETDEWRAYFQRFKRSAFRLEVHQVYTMPGEEEDVRRWLAGESKPADDNNRWHTVIRANVAEGKTMQRAKIVRQPFTEYTRMLMEWFVPDNVAAGEDYRIIDITNRKIDLPNQDFWMFDEETVVHLNYRADGTQINRELIDNPDIGEYLRWRDIALKESVPFSEYRA